LPSGEVKTQTVCDALIGLVITVRRRGLESGYHCESRAAASTAGRHNHLFLAPNSLGVAYGVIKMPEAIFSLFNLTQKDFHITQVINNWKRESPVFAFKQVAPEF
jgi:hypothetical protein